MHKSTLAVHAGRFQDSLSGGVNSPIIASSAYDYINSDDVLYPRYFNTLNQQVVVDKLRALEGAEAGLMMSSGMAALSTLFMALLQPGDHVIMTEGIYGGTLEWAQHEFKTRGVECEIVPAEIPAIAARIKDNTRLIHVESPGNPFSNVIDLQALVELARQKRILTSIDNTYATPILQNPIRLGMDVVMHSGTKYLGGHSDLCCGILLASAALIEKMRPLAIRYGGSVNAQTAWLLERSLKTLSLRVQRQSQSGLEVAQALAGMDAIGQIHYPGLPDSPDHELATRQMNGFGGMLAFELASHIDPTEFQRRLKLIQPAVSFGGVDSTLCQPALTSHAKISQQERQRLGITQQLIRLSVGIENPEDIVADLNQALALSARA